MKILMLIEIAALSSAGALYAFGLRQSHAAPPPAAPPQVSAAVSSVPAERTVVPLLVGGFGDLVPARVEAVNFARPGILTTLRVVVGQRVRRGDPVARLASDPLAEAAWRQARSALTLAQGELQRQRSLFALQLATASQVQTAVKVEADARANLDAQEKLGGGMASSDAVAPFDGVVLALNAAQGDRLAAGAPVLQIGRTDRLKVNLGVEPALRQRVRPGQPVTLRPLGGASGTALPTALGKVADIQDLVDARTQLLTVTVEVARLADSPLVPGMRIQGSILVGQQDGWKVPRSAVLSDDQGAWLFQVDGKLARRVPVTSLVESGDSLMVSGALTAARPVVSLGNYELKDGMQVREAAK